VLYRVAHADFDGPLSLSLCVCVCVCVCLCVCVYVCVDLDAICKDANQWNGLQALGSRCMSAEATERPKFDEILHLVDELDVDA